MKNRLVLSAILTLVLSSAANAQSLPVSRTCTILAPAEQGNPRLVLTDSVVGDKVTTYIQINGPTTLSGRLDDVAVTVKPFDAVTTASGVASSKGASPFVRANIAEGWAGLLNRIRKGEELSIKAGDQTIVIPLVGSGIAVNALQKCAR